VTWHKFTTAVNEPLFYFDFNMTANRKKYVDTRRCHMCNCPARSM